MQSEMLKQIHRSHFGIEKCKHHAKVVLLWPGLGAKIEDFVCLPVRFVVLTREITQRNLFYPTLCPLTHGKKLVLTNVSSIDVTF